MTIRNALPSYGIGHAGADLSQLTQGKAILMRHDSTIGYVGQLRG